MWEALRIAQAEDFVRAMPGGLEARIEQGGTNVSGGQRQRLSIARALIRKPEIYLFDDSFSALDLATDARLRMAWSRTPPTPPSSSSPSACRRSRPPTRSSCIEDGAVVRSRHARGAARHEPDVRRDRAVPDRRAGDGGMSSVSERATSNGRRAPASRTAWARGRSPGRHGDRRGRRPRHADPDGDGDHDDDADRLRRATRTRTGWNAGAVPMERSAKFGESVKPTVHVLGRERARARARRVLRRGQRQPHRDRAR